MKSTRSLSHCGRRLLLATALLSLLSSSTAAQPAREPAGTATELHRAVRAGDESAWRALLAARADVNSRDPRGNTALHWAALRADLDAVEALLAAGADARAVNAADATPLHYGTRSARIVAALLKAGAPADKMSKIGVTPLLAAVAHPDSFAVAQQLINAGANVNVQRQIPIGPHGGASILAIAVKSGDRRTVKLLLESGANVNPGPGTSPLAAAAYGGDLDTARLLLDHGADVNHGSGFAGSPLNFALLAGEFEVARLLIERGADLNRRSSMGHGTPPMVWSAYNDSGDPAIARLLVERGVDIDSANDYGETALSYALKRGDDTPLVRYLREAGAKPPPRSVRAKIIPTREVPSDPPARLALIRDSAQRAVNILQRNSTAFLENGFVRNTAKCVSCHQQALPAVAFGLARERGLQVDDVALGRQFHDQLAQRMEQAENAWQMDEPTPSADVTLGYDADALHAIGYPGDDLTDAMSHYLLGVQLTDGSWASKIRRPPMEDGPIIGTAWSVRAVQLYPPTGRAREAEDALRRARGWLTTQQARTHNERVFQLLGLAWANEEPARLQRFVRELRATQRADGGWGQLPGLPSDAWATGSALHALYKAGTSTSDETYQRAIEFLLRTQFEDGSWWVRSRTWPFQPHFDGQFPHGKDQWISAGGTAWAAIALLVTLEPAVSPETLANTHTLVAKYRSALLAAKHDASRPSTHSSARAVRFSSEVYPLFKRSCAECHTGDKVKGGLSLASRESLLKGGQSGDPAIVPGKASDSLLIRYVSDQIEDLEMPPIARREKYPPLSAEEIALIREWIDAGAEWDAPR